MITQTVGTGHDYSDLGRLLTLMTGDEKHSTSATSTLDVIWVLYDRVMRYRVEDPEWPERDRFLLSKGHGPMAYYAVLAAKGFIDEATLESFGSFDSPLGYHPDRMLIPGVEISSGSLGHGLAIAAGSAAALRARGNGDSRIFVLLGDAELDEGSNHEVLPVAAGMGLDNLTAIVIDNRSSSYGWRGGIASRFEAEGWAGSVVDGRDHDQIRSALDMIHKGRPQVVVAEVEDK